MPLAIATPPAVREGLYLLAQGSFALYALFSLVVVAAYVVKKARTRRLIDGRASPLPLAVPPAGPWMFAFNVVSLLFVPSAYYVSTMVALLLLALVADRKLTRDRSMLARLGAWLFVVNIFALLLMQSPLYMLIVVMSLTVLLLESGKTAAEQFGLERLSRLQLIRWSILISGAVVAVVAPLTQLYDIALDYLPYAHPEQKAVEIFRGLDKTSQIAEFFLEAVLISPLIEELFFRGFLQALLKKYLSTWPAVVLSAGIFALAHMNLEAFVGLWVLGIVLGVVYEHTGSILLAIAVHACFNLSTGLNLLVERGNPFSS